MSSRGNLRRHGCRVSCCGRVSVGDRNLEGQLRIDTAQEHSYQVYGQNGRFYRLDGEHFRANQIWRTVIDRRTGNRLGEELVRSKLWPRQVPPRRGADPPAHTDGRRGRRRPSSLAQPARDRASRLVLGVIRSPCAGWLAGVLEAAGRLRYCRPSAFAQRVPMPLGYGVIGSPTGSGPVSLGSSPSTPAMSWPSVVGLSSTRWPRCVAA